MNERRTILLIVGILLLFIGGVLVGYSRLVPAAAATYDTTPPTIITSYPDSTDPNTPTPFLPGSVESFRVTVFDEASGVDTSRGECIIYYGEINPDKIWKRLSLYSGELAGFITPPIWIDSTPTDTVTLRTPPITIPTDVYGYTFLPVVFKVYDKAGNVKEHTVYAVISHPKIRFYINNIDTEINKMITVNSPELNFTILFEKRWGLLSSAAVYIYYKGMKLEKYELVKRLLLGWEGEVKEDGVEYYKYFGTYTLPEEGYYEIKARIIDFRGKAYTLASVLVAWKAERFPWIQWLEWIGWGMIAAGLVCTTTSFVIREEGTPEVTIVK